MSKTRFAFILVASFASFPGSAGADQDFDLGCAVAAAATIGTTAGGSPESNAAFQAHAFYLGRLSVRNADIYWRGVVLGRLSETRGKGITPEQHGRCLDFFTKHL